MYFTLSLFHFMRRRVVCSSEELQRSSWSCLLFSVTELWIDIYQLLNLFECTPRICNIILLLIVRVRPFSKMLPSVKFTEDKVLAFVNLREKCWNSATLSLTLIITLISRADKLEWYCRTLYCCQINLVQIIITQLHLVEYAGNASA